MKSKCPAIGHSPRRPWIKALCTIAWVFTAAVYASPLPSKPAKYVEDPSGVLSPQAAASLNARLEQFERETSNQVVVAIYPDLPADFQMEDFTQRTAEAWGVGQRGKNNGAVFFLFPNARKMRIEVGYGLEGAIPDAVAKRILDNEVRPALRNGDFDAGVTHGVEALMAAAKGEYQGTGRTVAESTDAPPYVPLLLNLLFILPFFAILYIGMRTQRNAVYGPRGRRSVWLPADMSGGPWTTGSGGSSSGGGGGFSGGGGSFGGGGSSGSW